VVDTIRLDSLLQQSACGAPYSPSAKSLVNQLVAVLKAHLLSSLATASEVLP
jgi:hypothetical protein